MLAANMDGSEKLKLLVIGNSTKPRFLKGIKTLPVDLCGKCQSLKEVKSE